MRPAFIALAATMVVAGCSDATSPTAGSPPDAHPSTTTRANAVTDPRLAPTPTSVDRVVFDSRASLQQATSFTQALAAFGYTSSSRSGWGFTQNLDGRGTNALRVDWRRWDGVNCVNANPANIAVPLGATPPRELFVQWKQYMGRTATGGGLGTLGAFTVHNTACTNAGRTLMQFTRTLDATGTRGKQVSLDVPGPGPSQPTFRGAITALTATEGFEFHPEGHDAEVIEHTVYLRAETAPGAGDGEVRLYINGKLFSRRTPAAVGATAFAKFQFPMKLMAPARDQSEYYWDIVAWTPGADGGTGTGGDTTSTGGDTTSTGGDTTSTGGDSTTTGGDTTVTPAPAPVTRVDVTPATAQIGVGETTQLTVTAYDSAGNVLSGRAATWRSGDTNIMTVSASGLVTDVQAGSAWIYATVEGRSDSARVTATAPVTAQAVVIAPASVSMTAGMSQQFTATVRMSDGSTQSATSATWSATGGSISATGLYTSGVAGGSYQVIVTQNGLADTAAVTLTAAPVVPPSTQPGVSSLSCSATGAPAIPTPTRTLYVDAATGNDASAGTESAPWKTLDKVNSSVRPGDLVYVRGTFSGQWINPATSGTASAKIVIAKWPGSIAIFDGGRSETAVYLSGRSHIVVDGIEMRNAPYVIQMVDGSSNNWLRNLYVHNIGTIFVERSSDNRIEDSRIERCGSEANNSGDCIWIAYNANRNVIARNVMRYGGHALIDIGGDKPGLGNADDNVVTGNDLSNGWANNLGLLGFARRTVVECNRIHDATQETTINYPRGGMNINSSANIIRFNLIYGNKADGIQVQGYNYNGATMSPDGNQIYSNTFANNGGASILISQQQSGVVSNTLVADNIFWNNAGRAEQSARYQVFIDLYNASSGWSTSTMNGNVIRNNIIANPARMGTNQWLLYAPPGGVGNKYLTLAQAQSTYPMMVIGNLEVDPLLNADYTIRSGSQAIDGGYVVNPAQRYRGAAPDMGAIEF